MKLKESYRYANFLDNLLMTAYQYLQNEGFVTTTKQNHLRSKANPDASDETIYVQKPYDVDFTPNDVIDFTVKVIAEKELLTEAIAKAKASAEINIDTAIAMNKKKQQFANVLNHMAGIKPSEKQTTGRSYKFDANGEQKPYVYDIINATTIDFNRNDVKKLVKKYLKEADEISAKLDAIEINTMLDFHPQYDVNGTFEDLVTS